VPPTTETFTPRQQQASATKARIAEAAMRLFAEQGFAATSTRQIAQAAGISEGLIFRYFPTKLELLLALSGTRRTLTGEVKGLLEEVGDQPASVCLRRVAESFMRLARLEAHFLNMMLGESRTNDELYALFAHIVGSTAALLAGYLDTRVKAGELRRDLATESAARSFLGSLVLFFLTHKHLSDKAWAEASQRYAAEVLDLWFRGALSSA